MSDDYSLENDLKLGVKSLCYQYLNSLLNNIEYSEIFQTLSVLFEDLAESLALQSDTTIISSCFNFDITKKSLIKLISMSFLKDDSEINNYDLSLEEKINLQLEMIKTISSVSKKKMILILNTGRIYKSYIERLEKIDSYTFVFFERMISVDNVDLLLLGEKAIDLDDEEELFEICNNSQAFLTIKDLKEKLKKDHLLKRIV